MNALRAPTRTLAGLFLAGLALLAWAPDAARADARVGEREIDYGRAEPAPSYAAIAYSPTTKKWGHAWGCSTRAQARRLAAKKCGAPDARTVIEGDDSQYLALVIGKGGAAGATAATAARARAIALQEGRDHTTDCKVVLCFFAGYGEGR